MEERVITKESIDGLIRKLGLPPREAFSQDWQWEIASDDIAVKVLEDYINRDDLTEDEKFTLMHVIIESVNDYISMRKDEFPLMAEFRQVLIQEYELHKQVLYYFACWENEDLNDAWEIAPLARSIIEEAEEG